MPLANGAPRDDLPVQFFQEGEASSFRPPRDERDFEQYRVSSEYVTQRNERSAGAGYAAARESLERNRPREPSGL